MYLRVIEEIDLMQNRIFKLFIVIAFFFSHCLLLFALEVSDGKIKLILHDDIGRFSIYYMSDPENKKYIPLFTDQDPRTTTFSIIVNNKAYRLGDSISFKETSEKTANGAKFTWKSNQLEITQEFSFIKSVMSTESDGVKISIIFTNISDSELEIGARFIIDTNLGESSSAHFKTNNNSKISKETKIDAAEMTDYWLSPKDENTGLMVVTKGSGITTPDIVIFANWKRLNDTSWSYTTSGSRNFNLPPYSINDSAVCHYYFPQKISSGLSSEIVLVMGNYSDSGYILKKTNTSNVSTTSSTTTNNTTITPAKTNEKASTTLVTSDNSTKDNNSIVTISIKGDISTLETVIEEINSKLSNNNLTEADIVLIEKILSELKTKANNYYQNK